MRFHALFLAAIAASTAQAELFMPAIFSDHMVLQQQLANPVWGWDKPGTEVKVSFGPQSKTAKAGEDGRWEVKLDPLTATAKPATMQVAGSTSKTFRNVVVGEVWICSGQSNMQWPVQASDDADVEIMTAKFPQIRILSVPQVGTQEAQRDFIGRWAECSPTTIADFSAVGYSFGRVLHQALEVPIGLIDNAWGGSAAEAWVRRDLLEGDPRFQRLMENAVKQEFAMATPEAKARHEAALAKWKKAAAEAKQAGKPFTTRAPSSPETWLKGQARPANIYNGVLLPTIGYGIKGVIWYQGESNSSRAYEYASLFPFMIEHWRREWKQGDFPFYWVQLADFKDEVQKPGDSDWAELRESQTKTQSAIKNGGQAVIIDLGEGRDIHPRNKRDVAERLARLALAKDYGKTIPHRSPEYKSVEFKGDQATVTIDTFGSSLYTFDVTEAVGFAVCGEDKVWHWAKATLVGTDKVKVHSDAVSKPVAVRYAWADNPVCNVYSKDGLPLTPFRTDDFPMITAPKP
jgi:sialate O-acetylesterase